MFVRVQFYSYQIGFLNQGHWQFCLQKITRFTLE